MFLTRGDFTWRKTRRMYSETASNQHSVENVHILLIILLETSCLWYSTKCQLGVPEVICKATQQLACLIIIQGGCLTCSPKQSHKTCACLVWVPGYHSFPKCAISCMVAEKALTWVKNITTYFLRFLHGSKHLLSQNKYYFNLYKFPKQ